jgi:hypothetical protein
VEFANDLETLQEITPAPTRPDDELIRLPDVLAAMPATQRRAILLREWQGLSYREIGEALELSQAAVETLLFRARRSLAQGLQQEPERPQKRVSTGASFGSLFAGLKSLLVGGSAVKIAATAAVVAGASVAAGGPLERHFMRPVPKAPAKHVAPAHHAPAASHVPVASVAATPAYRPVSRLVPAAHPVVKHPARHVRVVHRAPRAVHPVVTKPVPAAPVAATPAPAVLTPAAVAPTPAPTPVAAAPVEQPQSKPSKPAASSPKPEKKPKEHPSSSAKPKEHGRGATPGEGQQPGATGGTDEKHQDPAPAAAAPPAPSDSGSHDVAKLPPLPAASDSVKSNDKHESHKDKSSSGDGHGGGHGGR